MVLDQKNAHVIRAKNVSAAPDRGGWRGFEGQWVETLPGVQDPAQGQRVEWQRSPTRGVRLVAGGEPGTADAASEADDVREHGRVDGERQTPQVGTA